jgi:hypothetical protein
MSRMILIILVALEDTREARPALIKLIGTESVTLRNLSSQIGCLNQEYHLLPKVFPEMWRA